MAQAVLEMFPEAKYTIGPPIEDGFYYDFDLPRPLTTDDLAAIEKRMRADHCRDHFAFSEEGRIRPMKRVRSSRTNPISSS